MYNTKYQIAFDNINGDRCTINLKVDNYSGSVIQLTGGGTPLTISYDGDDENIYDPVRNGTARMQIFLTGDEPDIFTEFSTISDKEIWVECILPKYNWYGWLIADQSSRTFFNEGYSLSFTAKDPFSLMKTKTLFDVYSKPYIGSDDRYIKVKYILYTCFSYVFPDGYDIRFMINSGLVASNNGNLIDWWETLLKFTELCDDTSMKKAYDMLEKIMLSFGMYCFIHNGIVYINNPLERTGSDLTYTLWSLTTNVHGMTLPSSVQVGINGSEETFAIGNNENITLTQAKKEVSCKYSNNDPVTLMYNPFFAINNQGNINSWTKNVHSVMESIASLGDGNRWDPFRTRLTTKSISTIGYDGWWQMGSPYLWQATTFKIPAGSTISIKVKVIYGDIGEDVKPVPSIPLYIFTHRFPTPTFALGVAEMNAKKCWMGYQFRWASWNDLSDNVKAGMGGQFMDLRDAFTSRYTPGQPIDIDIETDPSPEEGYLHISFFPPYQYSSITTQKNHYDIVSVFVDYTPQDDNSSDDYISKSQTSYLTQGRNLTLVDDTEDLDYCDKIPLFYHNTGTQYALKDEFKPGVIYYSEGVPTDVWEFKGIFFKLAKYWTMARLFFNRKSLAKTEVDVFSDDVNILNLAEYRTAGQDILPNMHQVMTYEYNVKENELSSLTTIELDGNTDSTDIYQEVNEMTSINLISDQS